MDPRPDDIRFHIARLTMKLAVNLAVKLIVNMSCQIPVRVRSRAFPPRHRRKGSDGIAAGLTRGAPGSDQPAMRPIDSSFRIT